jgi:glycosyltransferase involved in cell wall biosynthesis
MTVSVIVTHPGRQHSHRAAMALERAGRLAGYWSGVPARPPAPDGISGALWRRFVRYEAVNLPAARIRSAPWVPGARRLGGRLPGKLASRVDLAACRAFDRWAAKRLRDTSAGAVLACEISALSTFREARRRGWVTLLDAPSIHHAAQDRLHGYSEPLAIHERIVALKDEEIALADVVVVVSSLARESYLEAGVAPGKVVAVPLGADIELFGATHRHDRGDVCRFLFAGAPIARKGFDLLVEALRGLVEEEVRFELRLVGPRGEQSHLVESLPSDRWSAAGRLSQRGLATELAMADCLVLPSRNDSYGMVVAEALAAGVPVVVSSMVGARELVSEGIEGWVVPAGESAALAKRLRYCAENVGDLRSRAAACRERARSATWEAYEARFIGEILPRLDERFR